MAGGPRQPVPRSGDGAPRALWGDSDPAALDSSGSLRGCRTRGCYRARSSPLVSFSGWLALMLALGGVRTVCAAHVDPAVTTRALHDADVLIVGSHDNARGYLPRVGVRDSQLPLIDEDSFCSDAPDRSCYVFAWGSLPSACRAVFRDEAGSPIPKSMLGSLNIVAQGIASGWGPPDGPLAKEKHALWLPIKSLELSIPSTLKAHGRCIGGALHLYPRCDTLVASAAPIDRVTATLHMQVHAVARLQPTQASRFGRAGQQPPRVVLSHRPRPDDTRRGRFGDAARRQLVNRGC